MTRVEIADGRLRVEVLGWHKLWAFKNRLDIPLENVVEIYVAQGDNWLTSEGLRCPGTALPGVIRAGSYYQWTTGNWTFWDVCKLRQSVVIELRNEGYTRLIVEVEDPFKTVEMVGTHLR
jgi:hypothetical protein